MNTASVSVRWSRCVKNKKKRTRSNTVRTTIASALPTIIVPVFNAFEALDACLHSLTLTLPDNANVLICDDASTDPKIEIMLSSWCMQQRFVVQYVRHARNLGFAANCNYAFKHCAGDVLVFHSDAIATPGWLQAMLECTNAHPRVASVVPWSNNAGLVSFPRFLENNPLPEEMVRYAAAASRFQLSEPILLPSAMGFCMWMSRAAIESLGGFDADTFPEADTAENDWSQRTAMQGWQHQHCPRAYVGHIGSASFSAMSADYGLNNMQVLLARWPDYHEVMARFILQDPLRELRQQMQMYIEQEILQGPQGTLF